ncbi:MAG: AAA family ATPase [Magnetococcales bacterium]|nr:AAA family ATPase [Magnetococcales bacterium]
MAFLDSFRIQNFKSILDQTIDLGKLNLFIGPNGAGKSNILDAFAMYHAAASFNINESQIAIRGARLSPKDLYLSYLGNNTDNYFTLSGGKAGFRLTCSLSVSEDRKRSFQIISRELELKNGKKKDLPFFIPDNEAKELDMVLMINHENGSLDHMENEYREIAQWWKSLQDGYVSYLPVSPVLQGIMPDTSMGEPLGLYGGSLAKAIKEIIEGDAWKIKAVNELFESFPEVTGLPYRFRVEPPSAENINSHLHPGSLIVTFQDRNHPDMRSVFAGDAPEGASYVLFVMAALCHPDSPRFFALDNVDHALNPGLVRNLIFQMSHFIKQVPDRQVLMTSHNPTALDAIDIFNADHRLFVVRRGEDGATIIDRIKPPDGMNREEWSEKYKGAPLSDFWLSGAFSGALTPMMDALWGE